MKKLILFLLIGALLLLPLSGCFANNKQNEGTTPDNTTESTTPEATTPEGTTPEDTTPAVTTPETTTPEVTTPPENNPNNPPLFEGELDKNHPLIVAVLEYIDDFYVSHNPIFYPLAAKIDFIKQGRQALHVAFNPSNYYFVCGYYNTANKTEENRYSCAEEYTWKIYSNEADIQEYFEDMEFMVAFQINKALSVTDILSSETNVPDIEHIEYYMPTFENGVNVGAPLTFDETFIYLNQSEEIVIYYRTTLYYHRNVTIPCVCIEGEYYLPFYLATIEFDEEFNVEQALSADHLKYELNNYYDALINIMDTEKYRVELPSGSFLYYGIVSLEDFVNKIIK